MLKFSRIGDFNVVASGTLGLLTKDTVSVSVGAEENVDMYPIDFEEFLWTIGLSEKVIDYVKNHIHRMEPIDESVLDSMYGYMRWYMVIGGMPEAVGRFVKTKKLDTIRCIQKDLLCGYEKTLRTTRIMTRRIRSRDASTPSRSAVQGQQDLRVFGCK